MGKRTSFILYGIAGLVVLLIFQCMKPQPSTPLDGMPTIDITTPMSGNTDIITADSFSVILRGNNEYSLFRFRLDHGAWSEFSKDSVIRLSMLDDGAHVLNIESEYEGRSVVGADSCVFFVKRLDSTAVYMVPQKVVLNGTSDTAVVRVEVKNLPSCDRMHFAFTGARIDSLYLPESKSAESPLLFAADTNADILVSPGGALFKGTSAVLMLRVIVTAGSDSTRLSFTCSARDTGNVDLKIRQIRGCVLVRD